MPCATGHVLIGGVMQHKHHPYPSLEDRLQLSRATGLTPLQVQNWSVMSATSNSPQQHPDHMRSSPIDRFVNMRKRGFPGTPLERHGEEQQEDEG